MFIVFNEYLKIDTSSISTVDTYNNDFSKKLIEENIFNKSTIDIKTLKISGKNLIPFSKFDPTNRNCRSKSPININNNINLSHSNYNDDKIKPIINTLKLCQSCNLPNEKSYIISDKNLKLIEKGILDKDNDIENLNNIIKAARRDFLDAQEKYQASTQINSEIIKGQEKYKNQIIFLNEENSKLKKTLDKYISEFSKVMIIYKKIKKIINIIFSSVDIYTDFLSVHNNPDEEQNNMKCEKTDNFFDKNLQMKLLKNLAELLKTIDDNDIRNFDFLLKKNNDRSILIEPLDKQHHSNNSINCQSSFKEDEIFLNDSCSTKKNYIQEIEERYSNLDKENQQLKGQFYDLDNYLSRISSIFEEKNLNLSETAKDVIAMKKRILEINRIITSKERENSLLKISLHNLQNEITNNQIEMDKRINQGIKQSKIKYTSQEEIQRSLNDEIIKLKTQLENNEKYSKIKEENDKKNNEDLISKIKYNRFNI